jgi:bifunctional UDP-N-acetylglucosamine pyrophosphorylase/glucosamine-1-phosphate N-acetyltransferase
MNSLGVILLAAGQGTRMKSTLPKVLHPLGGKPLFLHPLAVARRLDPQKIVIVIGHGGEAVRRACRDDRVAWVVQEKQLGTGHAVLSAKESFRGFSGSILILSGDVPLITTDSLAELLNQHREHQAALTLMTAGVDNPMGYGRILRDGGGQIAGTVEERDATDAEKSIREINAGVYVASPEFLFAALERVDNRNRQGEYYLPDVVAIALRAGKKVATLRVEEPREIMGINTREELAAMEKTLRERINGRWMAAGVTLQDPGTTYIEEDVVIGKDTVIGPNTQLRGRTTIGERCQIDGTAHLTDVQLGDEVHLRFSVVLTGCRVERGAIIGPFAHLRPGTALGATSGISSPPGSAARRRDQSQTSYLSRRRDDRT